MSDDTKRWCVLIDEEPEEWTRTRGEAREIAAWWKRHPSVRDRRQYGTGGHVRVASREELDAETTERKRQERAYELPH